MKKIISTLFVVLLVTLTSSSMAAMSLSKVRKNARFLTDRMAYELNLSTAQYNDAYEINYDFIYNIRYVMDDAVRGNELALDHYYMALDIRNDDLRWVLSNSQYVRFMNAEYFYRPVYASGSSWNFRVYVHFTNHNYFYFGKPVHYSTYSGGHYRGSSSVSVYRNKYSHPIYNSGNHSVRRESVYVNHRNSDFGVTARPSTNTSTSRPSTSTSTVTRPSNSNSTNRPSSTKNNSSSSNSSSSRPSSTKSNSSGSNSSSSRPGSTSTSSGSSSSSSRSSSTSTSSSTRPSSSSSSSSRTSVSSSSSSGSSSSSRSNSGSSSSNSSSSSSRSSSRR